MRRTKKQNTPYVDVIVYSSGTLVAGADTGSATAAQNADFKHRPDRSTVSFDTTLTAGWAPKRIDYKLPTGITEIGEAAFEGTPLKSVEIPASCQWVYPDAFKGCTTLKQVLILSADTKFNPTAFSGCNDVYIFAPDGSLASYLCTEENGFIFVKTFR